ncbi:MAG: serine hydrolase domain-containing protein [Ilumatobacteraceae bacterium]
MGQLHIETDPAEVGLDADRLARIDRHFQRYVDDGRLPGWLISIARHGKVAHLSMAGQRDIESGAAVDADTIWRIYSMTKPLTAVAALTLWEQGAFELRDPVSKYIPAFAQTKVWRSGSTTNPMLEPMREPMQLWHLLSHTSGLTYGFMNAHPVDAMYRQAGFEWGVPADADLAAICDRLAALPLVFQPGTEWNYSMGLDVLGRVIEVITGQRFDEHLSTAVLQPLGMHDTAWSVAAADTGRLAALYGVHPATGSAMRLEAFGNAALTPPAAHLGGGGLVSTAYDYHRFTQMLINEGELDGVRVLSPSSVRYMASNHLPGGVDLATFGRPLFSEGAFDGVGFGLGVSVTIDPVAGKVPGSVGEFAWGGAASTAFWVDPVEDMTVQFFTQLLPSSSHPIRSQLKQLVYQAIID